PYPVVDGLEPIQLTRGCPNQKERPPMTTIPRPRLVSRSNDLAAEDMPEQVTIALRELAGAAKEGLLAFSVGIGLAVLDELFEAEVPRLAGPKGKHDADRRAYRHGHEP